MESVIVNLAEKSVLGAGFFLLLYYFIKNLERVTTSLVSFGVILQKISETLLTIDMRLGTLEDRIKVLERRD